VLKILLNYLEPSYHWGFFTVHLYGAFLAAGLIVGVLLAKRLAAGKGIQSETFYETVMIFVLAGIVGARLLSVALHPASFLENPLSIFALHHGGLAFFGGLAGGILAAVVYTRKKGIIFGDLADAMAPSLALGEAITRLGCDVYGYQSLQAPFPRIVEGVPYHNIPLYTFLATLAIFVVLYYLRNRVPRGHLFLLYLVMYGGSRTFIDYFRGEHVFFSAFNLAQLGSLGIALAALLLIILGSRKVFAANYRHS